MSANTTFNESDHPREGDGKFAAKDAPDSEASLGGGADGVDREGVTFDDLRAAAMSETDGYAVLDPADLWGDRAPEHAGQVWVEENDDSSYTVTVDADMVSALASRNNDDFGESDQEWFDHRRRVVTSAMEHYDWETGAVEMGEEDDPNSAHLSWTTDPGADLHETLEGARGTFDSYTSAASMDTIIGDVDRRMEVASRAADDVMDVVAQEQGYRADEEGEDVGDGLTADSLDDKATSAVNVMAASFYSRHCDELDGMDPRKWGGELGLAAIGAGDSFDDHLGGHLGCTYSQSGLDARSLAREVPDGDFYVYHDDDGRARIGLGGDLDLED